MDTRRLRRSLFFLAAALSLSYPPSQLLADSLPDQFETLWHKAQECEARGRWTEACACYDQILKVDRNQADVKSRFLLCLRHAQQVRRHRDDSFEKKILNRRLPEALDVYEEVLCRLQANYVERDQIRLTALFQSGLQELRFALRDQAFLQEHGSTVPEEKVEAFDLQLQQWAVQEPHKVREARDQVRDVALAGLENLGLNPVVTVMEFAWGASNALDEYTLLLTPSQFSYVQASLRGELVGVGLRLGLMDQKLVVLSVAPGSPGVEKGLKPGDRVVRIDAQATDGWSEDQASARLLGRAGTSVELEVMSPGDSAPRFLKLARQPVLMPSVDWEPMPRDGIGYIRIFSFQENTVPELKDAILQLQAAGMKALVLDLRGNPGGLFRPAVQVAEMFLTDGVIVITDSPLKRFKKTERAHNPNALTLPLVVLVDGETASAAEVLAGALKDNQRATLVGTTTYGKGCIQCPVPLETVPAGLWLTVAKYYSPANQPYHGRGVTPHILEEVDVMGSQRAAAWRVAQQLVLMTR